MFLTASFVLARTPATPLVSNCGTPPVVVWTPVGRNGEGYSRRYYFRYTVRSVYNSPDMSKSVLMTA